jgi:hypothetical protein
MTQESHELAADLAGDAASLVMPFGGTVGKRLARLVMAEWRRNHSTALRAAEEASGMSREDFVEWAAREPRAIPLYLKGALGQTNYGRRGCRLAPSLDLLDQFQEPDEPVPLPHDECTSWGAPATPTACLVQRSRHTSAAVASSITATTRVRGPLAMKEELPLEQQALAG